MADNSFTNQFKNNYQVGELKQVNLSNIGTSFSDKLKSVGLSVSTIKDNVTSTIDNLSSNLKGDTSSISQSLEKISPEKLINDRMNSSRDIRKTEANHNPTKKIETVRKETSTIQTIQYPPDIRKYYIRFGFADYNRPNSYAEVKYIETLSIVLPVPNTLIDPTSVRLNESEIGGVMGSIVENVAAVVGDMRGMNKVSEETTTSIKGQRLINQGVGAAYSTVIEGLNAVGLDDVTGAAGQVIGAIPNPHVTVFFQGVDLKTHQFTWKFAPKNIEESQRVMEIVRQFKKRSLPNYKWGAANVLGYPEVVKISIEPNSSKLYNFKPCFVRSVTVNYTPNGVPSFFVGGHPTQIELSVQFQELEIFTKQDYAANGENVNGDLGADIAGYINDKFGREIF